MLLLIDDDQDDRQIFREAVAECDPRIAVLFAADGAEALELLEQSVVLPDVIFLDYNMPKMNGIECLKRLKSNSHTRHIPTIMHTTCSDPAQRQRVMSLGADHYMPKAASFDLLRAELSALFDQLDGRVIVRSTKSQKK